MLDTEIYWHICLTHEQCAKIVDTLSNGHYVQWRPGLDTKKVMKITPSQLHFIDMLDSTITNAKKLDQFKHNFKDNQIIR